MKNIFLSPTGRMGRRNYWLGVAGLLIFINLVNLYLSNFPQLYVSFWIALFFPFFAGYFIYCIYGKRLHDLGRSYWPLTAMIVLEIIVIIGVMMAYGGAEYFSDFSQYERKAVIDEAVRDKLITDYQAEISANMSVIRPLFLIVPVLFTALLGLVPGQKSSNKYGEPA